MKENILKQLRRDEGEVLSAYQDHLGFWTIGVGRLIDKRKGGGLSPEESAFLLNNDVDTRIKALEDVFPWFKGMDEARKGVLVNMSFQIGVGGLKAFKNTLSSVADGLYDKAASQMLESLWATQTPERAKRLAEQMKTGEWK